MRTQVEQASRKKMLIYLSLKVPTFDDVFVDFRETAGKQDPTESRYSTIKDTSVI